MHLMRLSPLLIISLRRINSGSIAEKEKKGMSADRASPQSADICFSPKRSPSTGPRPCTSSVTMQKPQFSANCMMSGEFASIIKNRSENTVGILLRHRSSMDLPPISNQRLSRPIRLDFPPAMTKMAAFFLSISDTALPRTVIRIAAKDFYTMP